MPVLIDEVTAEVAPAATTPPATPNATAHPTAEPDPRALRDQLERIEIRMARVHAN